jgi:hypothetical protein
MNKDNKLQIKTSVILQGDFKFSALNVLIVFQVNCPGCFIDALPLACRFFDEYSAKGVKVFGLSTAFEDFELNTLENTQKLLQNGEIVGETKKTLGQAGYQKLPYTISFDVAFDLLQKPNTEDIAARVEDYCAVLPDFPERREDEKKLIKSQVHDYFKSKVYSAYTFDANNMLGTPAWVIFDESLTVLHHGFGHTEWEDLTEAVDRNLRNK